MVWPAAITTGYGTQAAARPRPSSPAEVGLVGVASLVRGRGEHLSNCSVCRSWVQILSAANIVFASRESHFESTVLAAIPFAFCVLLA
jgi:hypothetical protein